MWEVQGEKPAKDKKKKKKDKLYDKTENIHCDRNINIKTISQQYL